MFAGESTRPPVYGKQGVICSNSPLASATGLQVFAQGGNAFDAALAVAAVETVSQVPLCGLGGDSFILIYDSASGEVTGINSSGVAASGATAEYYRSCGHRTMPLDGPHAVGVPGEVVAWDEFHRRFCTLPFPKLLEPAIGYATNGFAVSPRISRNFASSAAKLAQFPSTAAVLVKGGHVPGEGDTLVNKDLADSLRKVAEGGPDEFYRGELARKMIEGLRSGGGLFTEADFANHGAEVYEPISTTYRGHKVYQTRRPSQGFLLLELLNLVEDFDLANLGNIGGRNNSDVVHLMAEAKKIAYADRNRLARDPLLVEWPLEEVISKAYAARRRSEIDPRHAAEQASLQPVEADGDTTYFCVADSKGNAVSWVHSLSNAFGSGYIAEGTGVLFNNRAGRGFSLEPGHPNMIAPGKRTMHTLNCYLTTKDGQPAIIGGTPGGDVQPQIGLQILSGLLDFGMGPQEVVDAPRWCSFPGTDPATLETPMELRVESDMPEETVQGLKALGHKVARRRPGVYDGKVQLIVFDHQRGVLMGASDPRGDGHAAAW